MAISQDISQVVVAVIRRGDELLLVQQQEAYDPFPVWILPGGSVEAHELLHEALAREVREETGLTLVDPGRLVYTVQVDTPSRNHQLIVYVFEVKAWSGQIGWSDPDDAILQACFHPLPHALHLLETDHSLTRYEPALSYLRGDSAIGSFWLYRRQYQGVDDQQELIWRPGMTMAS